MQRQRGLTLLEMVVALVVTSLLLGFAIPAWSAAVARAHAESARVVLFDSLTTAEPLDGGGYAFTGTKIFTSMAPAWTRLGIFGRNGDELVAIWTESGSDGTDEGGQQIKGAVARIPRTTTP